MSSLHTTVVALAVVFTSSMVSAQTVDWGIKGGVIFADVPKVSALFEDEGAVDLGYRVGVTAGGFVGIGLNSALAIQPEVLFAQKGFKGKDPFDSAAFGFNLDYIDIPVLIRVGPSGGEGFHLLAGPSFNFNIRAKGTEDGEPDEDFKDEIEPFEFGLVVGAGFYGSVLIVEGRYQEGLTNVAKATFIDDDESYRNRSFAALVGIRFR
jgi:Outer membrane protein beta-barrel domain